MSFISPVEFISSNFNEMLGHFDQYIKGQITMACLADLIDQYAAITLQSPKTAFDKLNLVYSFNSKAC